MKNFWNYWLIISGTLVLIIAIIKPDIFKKKIVPPQAEEQFYPPSEPKVQFGEATKKPCITLREYKSQLDWIDENRNLGVIWIRDQLESFKDREICK